MDRNEKSRPGQDGSPANNSNQVQLNADSRQIPAPADLVAADCWAIAALDALAGVR